MSACSGTSNSSCPCDEFKLVTQSACLSDPFCASATVDVAILTQQVQAIVENEYKLIELDIMDISCDVFKCIFYSKDGEHFCISRHPSVCTWDPSGGPYPLYPYGHAGDYTQVPDASGNPPHVNCCLLPDDSPYSRRCHLNYYVSFSSCWRREGDCVDLKNPRSFNLTEAVLSEWESNCVVPRECWDPCVRIEIESELNDVCSLCDLDNCAPVCSRTWTDVLTSVMNQSKNKNCDTDTYDSGFVSQVLSDDVCNVWFQSACEPANPPGWDVSACCPPDPSKWEWGGGYYKPDPANPGVTEYNSTGAEGGLCEGSVSVDVKVFTILSEILKFAPGSSTSVATLTQRECQCHIIECLANATSNKPTFVSAAELNGCVDGNMVMPEDVLGVWLYPTCNNHLGCLGLNPAALCPADPGAKCRKITPLRSSLAPGTTRDVVPFCALECVVGPFKRALLQVGVIFKNPHQNCKDVLVKFRYCVQIPEDDFICICGYCPYGTDNNDTNACEPCYNTFPNSTVY